MKLQIKLDNPKYCDGCPQICEVIFNDDFDRKSICDTFPKTSAFCSSLNHELCFNKRKTHLIRPQKCIRENGE